MRTLVCVLLCCVAAASGCSSGDAGQGGSDRLPVRLQSGQELDDNEPCGLDSPTCPDGSFCAVLKLEGGDSSPVCVDEGVCQELVCDEGECAIAESFPAQIFCSRSAGSDGDEPVSS